MTKILIRASKSPVTHFYDGAIPFQHLSSAHQIVAKPGLRNAGNLVFAHSTYKAISAPGVELSIDDYRLSLDDDYVAEAARINETFDAFVIPLCNSFRKSYGLSLARMTRMIRKLTIPCIVTGVGSQARMNGSFAGLDPIKEEVKDFVSAILDRSASMGVRGEMTRDYLVGLGFPSSQIDVIGCPSMFYNGRRMDVQKREGTVKDIAISLSNPRAKQLQHFLDYFNAHTENVTYLPQIRALMPAIASGKLPPLGAPNDVESPVPNLVREGRVKFFYDVVPWMDFMKTQDFAIGTRIHGNVVPLLAGTPAHVLVHDSRTLELAQYFEIPHTKITSLTDDFNPQAFYDKSDFSALNRNHGQRVDTYARFLERNGLQHILNDDAQIADYDLKLRETLETTLFDEEAQG